MTSYYLDITADLLLEIFESPIFEVFAILFLFAVGISAFQMIKKSV